MALKTFTSPEHESYEDSYGHLQDDFDSTEHPTQFGGKNNTCESARRRARRKSLRRLARKATERALNHRQDEAMEGVTDPSMIRRPNMSHLRADARFHFSPIAEQLKERAREQMIDIVHALGEQAVAEAYEV